MPIAFSLCHILPNGLISPCSVTVLYTRWEEFESLFGGGGEFKEGMCEGEDLCEFGRGNGVVGEVEEAYRATCIV